MKNDLNDRNPHSYNQYRPGSLGAFLPQEERTSANGPMLSQLTPQPPTQPLPSRMLAQPLSSQSPTQPLSPLPSRPPQPVQPALPAWAGPGGEMRAIQTIQAPPGSKQKQGNRPPFSASAKKANKRPSITDLVKNTSRSTKILVAVSAACIFLIVLGVWITNKATTDVTLYQVGNQNVTHYIGGGGIVFPLQQLVISYPVSERVVSLFVKPGDQVASDQPLLQLDTSQLNAQVEQAANDVAAAQAYLNSVSVSGNAVAIAHAQQQYNLAKDKYNALVAEASSSTLHNGKLVTPMGGVVTAVNINAGEVFSSNTPLVTIMDESKVIVRVKVPLLNLQQVQLGQAAIVTPSSMPNTNFPGVVTAIIPRADPQTDTFEVWVQVVNTQKALLPGMSAFARIQESGSGMTVPRLAVLNQDHEALVFVVHDQHAYLQPIQVTGHVGDTIIVEKGLSPGDRVVVVGADTLRNGQQVHIRSVE